MRQFQTVLAVIEPHEMRQVALERALALAQTAGRHKVKIVAVMASARELPDEPDPESETDAAENTETESSLRRHQKWLEAYLRINAMGYDVKARVIGKRHVGKAITAIAREEGADFIIKAADEHHFIGTMFRPPLDLQLLRHSPVPVLIAKDHIWHPTGTIAVALDFSDPADLELRYINMRLLREAQELSHITRCEIHLLNSIAPLIPPSSIDMPGFTPDLVGDEALKEACRNVLSFAARHRISPDNCHIREGQADSVIPALCAELNPTCLFIGTSARKGLAAALVGNICERVMNDLSCDLAVITPKAVRERIPYAQNSKK